MKQNKNSLVEMIMLSNSTHNIRLSDYIIKLICNFYSISEEGIKVKSRQREICYPRQVAMYLLKKNTSYSLAHIGGIFNGKDHATVLHAYRTIENLMQSDKQVKSDINKLNKIVKIKSKGIKNNVELDSEFYYINFNDYLSVKVKDDKGIILSGFTTDEQHDILEFIKNKIEIRYHENTGFYILEQKKKENG